MVILIIDNYFMVIDDFDDYLWLLIIIDDYFILIR